MCNQPRYSFLSRENRLINQSIKQSINPLSFYLPRFLLLNKKRIFIYAKNSPARSKYPVWIESWLGEWCESWQHMVQCLACCGSFGRVASARSIPERRSNPLINVHDNILSFTQPIRSSLFLDPYLFFTIQAPVLRPCSPYSPRPEGLAALAVECLVSKICSHGDSFLRNYLRTDLKICSGIMTTTTATTAITVTTLLLQH